jgi:hypothetical protein
MKLKTPSKCNKNRNIKRLGQWISTQNQNYKNSEYIMKNKNIRNIWCDFLENYKKYFMSNSESWFNNFKKAEDYIIEYKKTPSQNHKDKNIKKLGEWISNQQKNYKNNEQIMKNENIKRIRLNQSDFIYIFRERVNKINKNYIIYNN